MELVYINKNSLSKEICEDIIYYYNKDKKLGNQGITSSGTNLNIKNSWDLNIPYLLLLKDCDKVWKDIHKLLYTELYRNLKVYINSIKNKEYNNNNYNLFSELNGPLNVEVFQIQKYETNKGKYVYHNDFSIDLPNKKHRVITYLWYLNNVNLGGETEFLGGEYSIKPETGKLLLFPSTWTYPHCATIPISNDKYIITGWVYKPID
jgi:hypothetical protein